MGHKDRLRKKLFNTKKKQYSIEIVYDIYYFNPLLRVCHNENVKFDFFLDVLLLEFLKLFFHSINMRQVQRTTLPLESINCNLNLLWWQNHLYLYSSCSNLGNIYICLPDNVTLDWSGIRSICRKQEVKRLILFHLVNNDQLLFQNCFFISYKFGILLDKNVSVQLHKVTTDLLMEQSWCMILQKQKLFETSIYGQRM